MNGRLFSVSEAAERLGGVSKWTVQTWLSQGRIRRTKVGARTMVAEADILDFVRACNPDANDAEGRT
jgi:excisionase family DNA binding protein